MVRFLTVNSAYCFRMVACSGTFILLLASSAHAQSLLKAARQVALAPVSVDAEQQDQTDIDRQDLLDADATVTSFSDELVGDDCVCTCEAFVTIIAGPNPSSWSFYDNLLNDSTCTNDKYHAAKPKNGKCSDINRIGTRIACQGYLTGKYESKFGISYEVDGCAKGVEYSIHQPPARGIYANNAFLSCADPR